MKTVKLGLIGLGAINNEFMATLAKIDGTEVVAGFDVFPEARKDFTEKWGIPAVGSMDELLNNADIEGVTIATPNRFHLQNTRDAALAGKHICVTKPVTNTLEEADGCIDACIKSNVKLMVGHEVRYRPGFIKFKELLNTGVIGEISQIISFMGSKGGLKKHHSEGGKNWRDKWENAPGGSLNLLGIHNIDAVNSILGKPLNVMARCKALLTEKAIEDTTQSIVEYASGQVVFFGSSYCSHGGWYITAYGTKGTLTLDFNKGVILEAIDNGQRFSKTYDFIPEGGFTGMFTHFTDCIRNDQEVSCTGEDGKMALAVNWASIISEKEQRMVTIKETTENYSGGLKNEI